MAAVVLSHGGAVRGVAVGGGVTAFRGVPYGRARRFGGTEEVAGWAGVRDGAEVGAACPQAASR
jgi:para-nitrobenzyl esterase